MNFPKNFLVEKEVDVISGSSFGRGGENHVRIAYCKSYEQIEIALERISDFVKQL